MRNLVGCFVGEHDLRLVAVAAVICAVSCVATLALAAHGGRCRGWARWGWIGLSAFAGGSGVWATHFIAMLAFEPDLTVGYRAGQTAGSLGYTVAAMILGLGLATGGRGAAARLGGGAVVGAGIAAMHYAGMAAFEVPGKAMWSIPIVCASVAIGIGVGAVAVAVGLGPGRGHRRPTGAVLMVIAIVGLHFVGMGAVTIVVDPTSSIAGDVLSRDGLAPAIAGASLLILAIALTALGIDVRERRRDANEVEAMRSLANAAVEGLLVCSGAKVMSVNTSFSRLVGEAATGDRRVEELFEPQALAAARMASLDGRGVETQILGRGGERIPVEIIIQGISGYGDGAHYAVAVRDLRGRRKAESEIAYLAHHDPLTGLDNRAAFEGKLDQHLGLAAQRGGSLAVMCLDLDRFKSVNDIFGHAAGDEILRQVAVVGRRHLKAGQVMGRLGGDEFALILPDVKRAEAMRFAERLIGALSKAQGQGQDGIGTSIGVAVYPDDGGERESLMTNADTALYAAKKVGRGTAVSFEDEMGAEVRERRTIEHDLRQAVARGEMSLVYQPQCDIETREVTGFEVLLRWNHRERGPIGPSVFVPIAEECGAMVAIGEWVLMQACMEAATWAAPLTIAVNVSGVQLHGPSFTAKVAEALVRSGLAPWRLEVEITETALVRDPARALDSLSGIKALGCKIAMDDFGTGYSSLSNLRCYPFDKIKVDRSFVASVNANADSAAILRSVIGLGRGLGLPVIAEGVETDAERAFLEEEGCQAMQGYLIGRPSPIEAFSAIVRGDTRSKAA